mgnify:CR=1 FL=1
MDYLQIEKEMTKTYNTIARKYEKEAQEDWKDKKYIDKFLKYLNNNSSILDIASGTGELLKYYNDRDFLATGIDISKEMINISKRKVSNVKIIEMSLYDIDKLEENFDGISATFILVHIPKEKINEVIQKISSRLNKNGILLIVFTTSLKEGMQVEPLDNSCKYYVVNYTKNEICNILIDTGFTILESEEDRVNKSKIGIIIAKK